jgi:hypothetical protein
MQKLSVGDYTSAGDASHDHHTQINASAAQRTGLGGEWPANSGLDGGVIHGVQPRAGTIATAKTPSGIGLHSTDRQPMACT